MARIRTIKPEFWQNEELASISEPARLVAIGLLNLSDDEGFFKSHPRLIESALFPFNEPSVSIQDCLIQLSDIGYITIHNGSDSKQYGRVVKFNDHQKVNRPTPSKIAVLIDFTENSVSIQGGLTTGKERNRERKGTGKGREQGCIVNSAKTSFDDMIENIIDLYHYQLPELAQIRVRGGTIKKQINARLKDKDLQSGDWWRAYFKQVQNSDWLMGRSGNFKCTLQWLTLPTNMEKVLNGQYENHQAAGVVKEVSDITQQNIINAQAWLEE